MGRPECPITEFIFPLLSSNYSFTLRNEKRLYSLRNPLLHSVTTESISFPSYWLHKLTALKTSSIHSHLKIQLNEFWGADVTNSLCLGLPEEIMEHSLSDRNNSFRGMHPFLWSTYFLYFWPEHHILLNYITVILEFHNNKKIQ